MAANLKTDVNPGILFNKLAELMALDQVFDDKQYLILVPVK